MNKKASLPVLVQLAIVTLVTTVAWLGFEVCRVLNKETEPVVNSAVIEPLDPTLDQITLDSIVNKVQLEDAEIGDTILNGPVSQTPEPEEVVLESIEETVDTSESTTSSEINEN